MIREELIEKIQALAPFAVVSIDEFLPAAKSLQVYSMEANIVTENNNDTDESSIIIQNNCIVMAMRYSLFVKDATVNTTFGVDPSVTALRDIYQVELTESNAQIYRQPIDIFDANELFQMMAKLRLGFYLPKRCDMKMKVTRIYKGGASNPVAGTTDAEKREKSPVVYLSFSAYDI